MELITVNEWTHPEWDFNLLIRADGDPRENFKDKPESYLQPGQDPALLELVDIRQMLEKEFYALEEKCP